jgi:HEAT repeat protein
MGGGQTNYLHKAEVYNLILEGKNDAIVAMGNNAIPGLVSVLKGEEAWKKPAAVSILRQIEGTQALRALRIAATDKEWGIRLLALNAIALRDGKTVERTLREMMGDDCALIKCAAQVHFYKKKSQAPPAENNGKRNGNRLSA